MNVLLINNQGAKLNIDSAAINQLLPIINARPDINLILIRDKDFGGLPRVKVLGMPTLIQKFPGLLRSLYRLLNALLASFRYHPDFVNGVHLWPHGVIAFIVSKLSGIPCVISIISGSTEIKMLGKFMVGLALFCLRNSDVIVVTGENTRLDLIQKGVRAEKIVVIPNVIDIDHFKPNDSITKKYHIVSTNRLFPVKNLITFLEAVSIVKKDKPGLKVALGSTGPELSKLQEKVSELGLDVTVDFLGYMDDVACILNEARIYVITSCSEGFPIAVVEAMACGIPCVVSNVGDMLDVAKQGFNSIIIEDCMDAYEFAQAINSILNDSKLEKTLSKNALKIRESHSIASASRVWRTVINRLVVGSNSEVMK